jgi:hypothetical protein
MGWWTQAESREEAEKIGSPFSKTRDAIYIPTMRKNGEPIEKGTVEKYKDFAVSLGLDQTTRATGIWILSETGEPQVETIWIAYGDSIEGHGALLSKVATQLKDDADQDSVAYELSGLLNFI